MTSGYSSPSLLRIKKEVELFSNPSILRIVLLQLFPDTFTLVVNSMPLDGEE